MVSPCNIPSLFSTCGELLGSDDTTFGPCILNTVNINTTVSTCYGLCTYPQLVFSSAFAWEVCSYISNLPGQTAALEVITNCMSQYCDSPDPTLGGCFAKSSPAWQYAIASNFSYLKTDSPSCPVVTTINSDIGGIGVSDFWMRRACKDTNVCTGIRLLSNAGSLCHSHLPTSASYALLPSSPCP
jgi:hypothetical protein